MTIEGKRGRRRRELDRMRARAKRVLAHRHAPVDEFYQRFANNLAKCSCSMCGNVRYWEGATMQERRHFEACAA